MDMEIDMDIEEIKTKTAKTNAERQKLWRERQKEKMGIDEYNKKQAERHKTVYNKKRHIQSEEHKEEEEIIMPKLKPLKKRINPIIKSEIKESTQERYISFIKRFYKYYTKNDLNDDNDIIKAIKNEKFSYKKVKECFSFVNEQFNDIIKTYSKRLDYIYAIFSRIRGMTPIIKKLYPYQDFLQQKHEYKRQHKIFNEDKIKLISFEKENVLKKFNENENKLNYIEKILYLLTMLLPPRRYEEYNITKITNIQPDEKNIDTYNYYYDGNIYIYNCKSDTRRKTQKQESNIKYVINLPNEIINIINIENDFLFGRKYTQGGMSKIFANTFYKIYGIVYNIHEIRRLYITNKNYENLSYYEKKKIADAMNHSIEQQTKYVIPKENIK